MHKLSPLIAVLMLAAVVACSTPRLLGSSQDVDPLKLWAAYAACLRSHDYPEPDPTMDEQHRINWKIPIEEAPEAARQACSPELARAENPAGHPPSAALLKALQQHSQCMRDHGVTAYPDPDPRTGSVHSSNGPGSDLDPESPTYQAADSACKKYLPGPGFDG